MFYVSRKFINKKWPLRDKSALKLTYERLQFHKFSRGLHPGPLCKRRHGGDGVWEGRKRDRGGGGKGRGRKGVGEGEGQEREKEEGKG
jgi:hypothetical protein